MKKKIYFIISSIVQIIASAYIIIMADAIVQSQIQAIKEMYEMIPMSMFQEVVETLSARGANSMIVLSVINILINIAIIVTAIKNTILRNKGLLIVGSIVCFLFSGSGTAGLLAIINIIVLICLKREKPEDFPVKKSLPILEEKAITKKEIFIGLALIIIYFSQFLWQNYLPESRVATVIIIIGFYLTTFITAIAFWHNTIKRDLKALKDNFGTYLKFILPRIGVMYIIYIAVAIFSMAITKSMSSANQQTLESLPAWYVIPLAIIYAPIVEETIFRGLIHKIVKNKIAFIIISAVCFGLLHTITSEATLVNIVVKALPYSVLGGLLAYVYSKTENISTSMFCHGLINVIASILTLM